ncbi:cupin domain-containing protein [Thermodesulfobacteriota bacterium]
MKIFNTIDLIRMENPTPGERYRLDLITENLKAKKVAGIFVILPKEKHVPYHYHDKRESLILILNGTGMLKVENEEFSVKAGDVIFMPTNEKHMLFNKSEEYLRFIECYTPIDKDFVEII